MLTFEAVLECSRPYMFGWRRDLHLASMTPMYVLATTYRQPLGALVLSLARRGWVSACSLGRYYQILNILSRTLFRPALACQAACLAGHAVAFLSAAEMVTHLLEAQAAGTLRQAIQRLLKPDLLIVDDPFPAPCG